ncbi:agmatinase [Capillimicrobium parvum]|uniref:Guanidinobutyrase n=1 Tax=Capillimicrobium parvum TaxID=2884022 RepID=A0A9E6Y056_9ACTN|nr:agmatinase [Capillimicrobium parvum]UGS37223.1 Guanidinobutyrase [Capillimicrobium parvum]
MTAAKSASHMPYVGIASFLKAPVCADLDYLDADVGVIGIPFDEGTMNRPGTRFGPRALREQSSLYEQYLPGEGYYDIELRQTILRGVNIVDCGDVPIQPLALEANHNRMTQSIKTMLSRGALPISVGGDHSITYPVVQAFSDIGEIGIIQIDTHADVFTFYESDLTHGSPMINVARNCPNVTKFVQIGMRGLMLGEKDYSDSIARGNVIITSDEVRSIGVDWVLDQIPEMPYYLTFDIDSMDPSIAPGAGTPEPGGLLYHQARDLLRGVAKKGPIVGFDLVEVNPLYDPTGTTALLATRLVVDFLGAIFHERQARSERRPAAAEA